MIEINCTNCKELLQIDDAFAGGVCRCRHCGTIQTVPKRLKGGSASQAKSEAAGGTTSQVMQKQTTSIGSGTGLDDLAGIVASSGLASARLQIKEKKEKPAAKPQEKKDNRNMIILASAGGVIVLLIGIIIFMAVHNGGGGDPQTAGGGSGTGPGTGTNQTNTSYNPNPKPIVKNGNPVITPARLSAATFLGQPLTERSVAYVLDRGAASSSEGRLIHLKQALISSIRSLGPERKFAVIFWQQDGGEMKAFPADGLREANEQSINDLANFLDDIYPASQTSAPASTEKAFKTGAEAVVIVPIKTFIEPGTHTAIVKSRGNSGAKVYCYTLGQPEIGESFQKVAADTHGVYKDISMEDLKAAAQR